MKKKEVIHLGRTLWVTMLLGACSSIPDPQLSTTTATPSVPVSVAENDIASSAAITSEAIVPVSADSTDGLKLLEELRSKHGTLNDFLARNRKPDYFFSSASKKLFLIYLASDNLYLFSLAVDAPYKKFHPMPTSIRESLNRTEAMQQAATTPENRDIKPEEFSNYSEASRNSIENTLQDRKPSPWLDNAILQSIPVASTSASESPSANTPIYPKLYYFDKSLREVVENDYSLKYDAKKKRLKLIIPKAYEGSGVYKDKNMDTRKIYLERNVSTGKEMALVVPDFFPGSKYYRDTHGKVIKAFGSLYEVETTSAIANDNKLRFRYSIKLCQQDDMPFCSYKSNGNTYIRAIIISAVLYDSSNNSVVDTFVLK